TEERDTLEIEELTFNATDAGIERIERKRTQPPTVTASRPSSSVTTNFNGKLNLKELIAAFERDFEELHSKEKTKKVGSTAKYGKMTFYWKENKYLIGWAVASVGVLALLILPAGFFLGVFIGISVTLAALAAFVTFWLGTGEISVPHIPIFPELIEMHDGSTASLDRFKYATLRHILETRTDFSDELSEHEWFNLLFDRLWQEHTHNEIFVKKYIQKLNTKLLATKRPDYVGTIKCDSIDFGWNKLRIVDRVQRIPTDKEGEQVTEFYVEYTGNSPPKVKMSVELFINWPRERFATVNISVTVAMAYLSGRVRFTIPPGDDPLCVISFLQDPVSSFTVESEIGANRTKIQNVPKISSLLARKMQRFLARELVVPNGWSFHIPIKGVRQMKPLLLSKWRKRAGLPKDAEVHTEQSKEAYGQYLKEREKRENAEKAEKLEKDKLAEKERLEQSSGGEHTTWFDGIAAGGRSSVRPHGNSPRRERTARHKMEPAGLPG
ncbi:hypothetical protein PROFUN_07160, partial [Planoprotostelium fungivorum]